MEVPGSEHKIESDVPISDTCSTCNIQDNTESNLENELLRVDTKDLGDCSNTNTNTTLEDIQDPTGHTAKS